MMILLEMMLEVVIGVLVMEVGKVACGATWWPNFQLLHVAPPGPGDLVAEFPTKASGGT